MKTTSFIESVLPSHIFRILLTKINMVKWRNSGIIKVMLWQNLWHSDESFISAIIVLNGESFYGVSGLDKNLL